MLFTIFLIAGEETVQLPVRVQMSNSKRCDVIEHNLYNDFSIHYWIFSVDFYFPFEEHRWIHHKFSSTDHKFISTSNRHRIAKLYFDTMNFSSNTVAQTLLDLEE